MFMAKRPGTDAMGRGLFSSAVPSTSSKFDAGSVLTRSTFFPESARAMLLAQARVVFPTPPLPVKKRKRGAVFRNAFMLGSLLSSSLGCCRSRSPGQMLLAV